MRCRARPAGGGGSGLSPGHRSQAGTLRCPLQFRRRAAGRGQIGRSDCLQSRTLELKPDYVNAHNSLGNIWRALGNADEAEASYRRAIAQQPDFAIAHYNLGIVQAFKGQVDEAIASNQAAIALRPDLAPAHQNLGNVLKDAGRLDGAILAYRKALALAAGRSARAQQSDRHAAFSSGL